MKVYYTRHGQVREVDTLPPEEAAKYPTFEKPLSDLGREQARLLGERLAELGFHGKILSSPFMRALETASIIADIVGSEITPVACLREIFETDEGAQMYQGLTIDQIKKTFKHINPDSEIPDKWWYEPYGMPRGETDDEMCERVKTGILPILKEHEGEEELLLVGHAASTVALGRMYDVCKRANSRLVYKDQYCLFNCCLSMVDIDDPDATTLYCDSSHIPYEKCSANHKYREAWDAEFFDSEYPKDIPVPDGFDSITGKKVLHIGDTLSKDYPYYRKLIKTVNPDIIIHTGDMADEVKVGRCPEQAYEYRSKVEKILKIITEPGVPVIIVPGNNDVEEVIRELAPNAQICERNSIIEIEGQRCRVGHEVKFMTFDCPWSFYGHGPTGDEWSLDKNVDGVNWRFNVHRNSFVYSIQDKKYFCFPEPIDFE